jgi:oligopeptide transport system substrate-binding protein
MVSNGPYVFKEWQVGNRLEIERNPRFRDAASVAIDRVFFYPTEDSEAALRRIRAGELHIDRNFPMSRTGWLRENMPDYMHTHPYLGSYFYVVNVQKPPLDDLRVRQALNMMIDRKNIVRLVLNDLGFEPAYSLVPPTLSSWTLPDQPTWASWSMERRAERARKLLSEAGYGADNPLTFNLSYNTDEGHKRIAITVSKSWESIGVRAILENSEFRVHTDNVNQGNFDIARRGWIGNQGMPEFFLGLFESTNIPLNGGRWDHPDFDQKLSDALEIAPVSGRNELFREADTILQEQLPLFPIYYYVSRNLVSPRVTGWVDNPGDDHRIRLMDLTGE